jgi:hypothetical protein
MLLQAGCSDDGDLMLAKIGPQLGNSIILARRPTVFDCGAVTLCISESPHIKARLESLGRRAVAGEIGPLQ